jgi:NAD(P) transhydrogenase subunit alpha
VSLLPETVLQLKKLQVDVYLEEDAGINAFAGNDSYIKSGAAVKPKSEVVKQADILLRITPFNKQELMEINRDKVLVSVFNPLLQKEMVEILLASQFTTFSMDMVPRSTRAQSMDILSSMATVAGYKAVLDAAFHLPRFFPMFMSAAGTIKPAKVLILGAGVAGLQAVATSRKLGAVVEVFDVRSAVKEEVQSLGAKFIEVEGAREDKAAGGYAVEQTEEFKQKQRQLIHDHASKADVIITTAQIPGKKAPILISKETVASMAPGSVIVDLAASTGGNCELTQNGQAVIHNQVYIIGKTDYPSETPTDSSKMFGNNLLSFLKLIIKDGKLNLDFTDEIVKGTCLTYKGQLLNERVKQALNL